MTRPIWYSVLAVAIACVAWGFWISPSPMNNWYRYGYIFSGAVSLLAYAYEYFGRKRIAAILIFFGSISFLLFPGRTFAKLIISGDIDLLISTISTTYNVPTLLGYTTIQALTWRIDLLLFSLSFAVYHFVIVLVLLLSMIVKFKHARSNRSI